MRGKLIVMEGSDGSGKATQSRLLLRRLRKCGIPADRIAFPGYERGFFGGMVAAYLRGEFGKAVDPRLAGVLYAADRWEARDWINKRLAAGMTVICDRYVDSNKAHQAARMPSGKRKAFLAWVDELEFKVFKLPKPDFTIFLHVPHTEASRLIDRKPDRAYLKGKKRDAHEADRNHLRVAGELYLQLAQQRPARSGALIECVEAGKLLSRSQIADRVWSVLAKRGLAPRTTRK